MASKSCTDHLGNEFETKMDMCKHWNINRTTYNARIKKGWLQEKALTTPTDIMSIECEDHLGNIFQSTTKMCKYWKE